MYFVFYNHFKFIETYYGLLHVLSQEGSHSLKRMCILLLLCVKVKVKSLSHVWLFVTLWMVAHQAPLSMGFSMQEYCYCVYCSYRCQLGQLTLSLLIFYLSVLSVIETQIKVSNYYYWISYCLFQLYQFLFCVFVILYHWDTQEATLGYCCCSVIQSCPTLCDPMDCSMPGFQVLHHPLEFAHTHVHWMPSNHLCHPLLLSSIFPSLGVFSIESTLHIRWPKYWSFSFGISPTNEYSVLITKRIRPK